MTIQDFIDRARSYLNVRWRHQGRSREEGVDCVGLLWCAATECGLQPEDERHYGMKPGSEPVIRELRKYADEVPVNERRTGDVLLVRVAGEDPQHTLLMTSASTVIHASARHRKVVEHALEARMVKQICRVFRLRGLDG